MSRLITVHDRTHGNRESGVEPFVRGVLAQLGLPQPTAVAEEPVVWARVEVGRWVLDCPFCPSASLGDPYDGRFYCLECRNAGVNGAWVRAVYPADLDKVEAALVERPIENRNWLPGESVVALLLENAEHLDGGVGL